MLFTIISIINDVMSNDWGQSRGLYHQLQPSLKEYQLLGLNNGIEIREFPSEDILVQGVRNLVRESIAGLPNEPQAALALDGLDIQVVCCARHDNERHHRHFRAISLQEVVKLCEGVDHEVHALVEVLSAARREEEECIVQIKVVRAKEVSSAELCDHILVLLVQVLELVHGHKVFCVEPIGGYALGCSVQQSGGLCARDLAHGSEDRGPLSSTNLDPVAVVYPSEACLVVNVEVRRLELLHEVHAARAEVAPEERCVRCEQRGDGDLPLLHDYKADRCKPLVEMGDRIALPRAHLVKLLEEKGDLVPEKDGVVRLRVVLEAEAVLEVVSPLGEVGGRRVDVKEEGVGAPLHEPAPVVGGDPVLVVECTDESLGETRGCDGLELNGGGRGVVDPQKNVVVLPLVDGDACLGGNYGINASRLSILCVLIIKKDKKF